MFAGAAEADVVKSRMAIQQHIVYGCVKSFVAFRNALAAGEAAQFIAGLSGDDFICRDVPVKMYAQELKKIFRQ